MAGQSDVRSRRAAAVAAVDSAAAGQGSQRRSVLRRISGRGVFPAAWRRPERLWRQLGRRPAVGIGRRMSARPAKSLRAPAARWLCWASCWQTSAARAACTLISPLTWLRDQIQMSTQPLWVDFAVTAAIVSVLMFLLGGGIRTGWRALIVSLVDLCRHWHRDRSDGARPRRLANCRYQAVGRPSGDAGGVGHRHRDLDAGRHRAGLGPALDHPA